jgi:hypothetical protein
MVLVSLSMQIAWQYFHYIDLLNLKYICILWRAVTANTWLSAAHIPCLKSCSLYYIQYGFQFISSFHNGSLCYSTLYATYTFIRPQPVPNKSMPVHHSPVLLIKTTHSKLQWISNCSYISNCSNGRWSNQVLLNILMIMQYIFASTAESCLMFIVLVSLTSNAHSMTTII